MEGYGRCWQGARRDDDCRPRIDRAALRAGAATAAALPPPAAAAAKPNTPPARPPALQPKLPHTVTNAEWSPTTWRRSAAWERVAGEPIMLNPLRRLND